jgi:hypothetical protein
VTTYTAGLQDDVSLSRQPWQQHCKQAYRLSVVLCRVYAVQLADSVLVNKAGTAPETLTRFSPSEWADASYEIKDEEDEEEEEAVIDIDGDVDEDGGGSNTRCVPQPKSTDW